MEFQTINAFYPMCELAGKSTLQIEEGVYTKELLSWE